MLSHCNKYDPHTRTLRATSNMIFEIDKVEQVKQNAQALFISHNSIHTIENIIQFKSLKRLLVEFNYITYIEDLEPLGQCPIEELRLEGNPVAKLPLFSYHIKRVCPTIQNLNGRPINDLINPNFKVAQTLDQESSILNLLFQIKNPESQSPALFNHSIRWSAKHFHVKKYLNYLRKILISYTYSIPHSEDKLNIITSETPLNDVISICTSIVDNFQNDKKCDISNQDFSMTNTDFGRTDGSEFFAESGTRPASEADLYQLADSNLVNVESTSEASLDDSTSKSQPRTPKRPYLSQLKLPSREEIPFDDSTVTLNIMLSTDDPDPQIKNHQGTPRPNRYPEHFAEEEDGELVLLDDDLQDEYTRSIIEEEDEIDHQTSYPETTQIEIEDEGEEDIIPSHDEYDINDPSSVFRYLRERHELMRKIQTQRRLNHGHQMLKEQLEKERTVIARSSIQ